MTARFPNGARWDCSGCGSCCRMYDLGPVEPEIIAGLEAARIETLWAPAAERPWHEARTGPDGQVAYFLGRVDGHCVFLEDSGRCAIHARLGAAAKPGFCREYPFHVVEDGLGAVAVVRPSCNGYAHSYATGAPLEAQVAEVMALPRPASRRRFFPETVSVFPSATIPLAEWLPLEQELLSLLATPDDPEASVALLRRHLAARLDRALPAPDPERARLAAGAVVEALRRVMAKTVAQPPDPDPLRAAFVVEMHDALTAALPRLKTPGRFADDSLGYADVLLRSHVLARGWHAYGGFAEGTGAFLVGIAVARALASPGNDGRIDAISLGAVMSPWTRFVENAAIAQLLRMTRPALVDLFMHASPPPG